MLGYTYLAGEEVYVGEALRKRFFIYNALNLAQMLLMQLFVYALFAPRLSFSSLLLAHFLFTTVGTIIFEFVRKLKVPGEDGVGRDTYTYYLGFEVAHSAYLVLLATNLLLFLLVMWIIPAGAISMFIGGGCAAVALLIAFFHRRT